MRNHISAGSFLFSFSLSIVQLLHPYKRKVHTYTFTIFDLRLEGDVFNFSDLFHLTESIFGDGYFIFTSCIPFPRGGESVPKYYKVPTYLMLPPLL